MATRIGVDVGGTFTDLILYDEATRSLRIGKRPSTPSAPELGVLNVVDAAAEDAVAQTDLFLHGTTVGLNAILERKGSNVGLLTTRGFRDILEIRRSTRDEMYNLTWQPPLPLVTRSLRLEAGGRILADGTEDRALDADDVRAAARRFVEAGIECAAVVFINSHANPSHELAAEALLRDAGFEGDIALSHLVTGEYSEYERTSTTVVDAYVRPAVAGYFHRLREGLTERGFGGDCLVTRSGGGAMFFDEARGRPFETLMSGPVAGVAGTVRLCQELGISRAVTADVGGTSFDTSLIIDGRPIVKYEGEVDDLPLQTPWVDVRSIGAGGGSIASAEAGLLRVGPDSAGAAPGPVCYSRGGTQATVTDAAAALGMLGHGVLAGGMQLDLEAARSVVGQLGDELGLSAEAAAAGVVSVAAAAMAEAINQITVERGEDPRDAALVAFGGAGPLFGCLLGRELGISKVVVPPAAGNFSAWGLLCQDVERATARTLIRPLTGEAIAEVNETLGELFDQLDAQRASTELGEPRREPALDLRYAGQEHTITVRAQAEDGSISESPDSLTSRFTEEHERNFGHRLDLPVEIVNVRATVHVPLPDLPVDAAVLRHVGEATENTVAAYSFALDKTVAFRVLDRGSLAAGATFDGPAIITEETTITYVDHGFGVEVHPSGALFLNAQAVSPADTATAADPIVAEIVRNALKAAAKQIELAIIRTSISPILYDAHDFACGVFDENALLLGQDDGVPGFLGTLGPAIEACVSSVGGRDALAPGDVLLSTDAYTIGSHTQDGTIVVPAFHDGELIGFAAVKGHLTDIGQRETMLAVDTRDIWQEGAIYPGVKLYRAGTRNEDLWRTILANSRVPDGLAADINAFVGAARIGVQALERLAVRYGADGLRAAVERIFDHGEAIARAAIGEIADGRYVAQTVIEGVSASEAEPFDVVVEISGTDIIVDYTAAPQQQQAPYNAPVGFSVATTRAFVLSLIGGADSATEGYMRPIQLRTQPGTMLHPTPPAPVALYFGALDPPEAIYRALAETVPDLIPGSVGGGTQWLFVFGMNPDGSFWGGGFNFIGGQGAAPSHDGAGTMMGMAGGGVHSVSVEIFESRTALVVDEMALASDSGGPGRFRGCPGIDYKIRALKDMFATVIADGTKYPPGRGILGGQDGRVNTMEIHAPDGAVATYEKAGPLPLEAGTVIRMRSGGGGGYGPASERDPRAVSNDIAEGYVTEAQARALYPQAFELATAASVDAE